MEMIERQQALRFAFLRRVWEIVEGNTFDAVKAESLGEELRLSEDEVFHVTQYLVNEGLLEYSDIGGINVNITHWGIKEVERALTKPDESTNHFLPMNVIFANSISNSPIQQGNVDSIQATTLANQREDILLFLEQLRRELSQIDLDQTQRQVIEASADAVNGQMNLPEPNEALVREGLRSIRNALEQAVGSAVAAGLLTVLKNLS